MLQMNFHDYNVHLENGCQNGGGGGGAGGFVIF